MVLILYWTDENITSSPSKTGISNSPLESVIVANWAELFITLAAGTFVFLYNNFPFRNSLFVNRELLKIKLLIKKIFFSLFKDKYSYRNYSI